MAKGKKQDITEEMCYGLASSVVGAIKGSQQEATAIGGKLLWKRLKGYFIVVEKKEQDEEVAAGSRDG